LLAADPCLLLALLRPEADDARDLRDPEDVGEAAKGRIGGR
jgi:hypothetical protein